MSAEGAKDELSEDFLEQFFRAPTEPANNHEEWLLRLHAALFRRELEHLVRVQQDAPPAGAKNPRPRRRRPRGEAHGGGR